MTNPTFLLDTNIVSCASRGQYPAIARRIAQLAWHEVAISVATRAELMYGILLAPNPNPHELRVRRVLAEIRILDWDQEAADAFAQLRFHTRQQPVEHLDLMIAAHAMALGATLVTNDLKLTGHVSPWVSIENWVSEG